MYSEFPENILSRKEIIECIKDKIIKGALLKDSFMPVLIFENVTYACPEWVVCYYHFINLKGREHWTRKINSIYDL